MKNGDYYEGEFSSGTFVKGNVKKCSDDNETYIGEYSDRFKITL